MKKSIILLTIAFGGFYGAGAQSAQKQDVTITKITSCGVSSNKVCKRGAGKNVSCYTTKYDENFNVCKGNAGYYICCEAPKATNATHPTYVMITPNQETTNTQRTETTYYVMRDNPQGTGGITDVYSTTGVVPVEVDNVAPQSQSYTSADELARERAYLANYSATHYIRVCYNGSNVAEDSRAPYLGCPSPQDDGPDRNRERNINVSTPDANAPLAPVTGRPE